ncbi:MAG: hypothetical protein ABWY37_07225 [Microbacterium pygmaeum]|uniref:Modulator of FtsH protease n=1 Tax=Microbacterium pygmaeum TaxID=370764 RepID=A0A1G7XZU8_9MICO|nr:hypothetical protein [Microbacterium pygmaeum]SDG89633.1 hypothetical protein SAMN04489810_1589 [Microbacterium pygmaeum]
MNELLLEWKDFNVAIAGATAALGGLVIVAASVNIGDIVKSRSLTARLGSGIVMLVAALVVSASALMPAINETVYGIVVLVIALGALLFQIMITRAVLEDHDPRHKANWAKVALGFLPVAAYLVAGGLAVASQPAGLYFAAAGAILAIVAALIVSWVALVEVLR